MSGGDAVPSQAFRFASAMAEFGLLLRDSSNKGAAEYDHAFEQIRKRLAIRSMAAARSSSP